MYPIYEIYEIICILYIIHIIYDIYIMHSVCIMYIICNPLYIILWILLYSGEHYLATYTYMYKWLLAWEVSADPCSRILSSIWSHFQNILLLSNSSRDDIVKYATPLSIIIISLFPYDHCTYKLVFKSVVLHMKREKYLWDAFPN